MATTFNLGNIQGDQGFQGRETIVIFRPITIGDAVPTVPTGGSVATDGTITAPTDWFNPADLVFDATTQDLYSTVITWNPAVNPAPYTFLTWDVVIRDNGRAGADSTAPTIQIDTQPAGAAGSDPVFVEAAGSTEQARVYDITLSTGAQGEQGIPGPAGSASIFLTDTVSTTIPTRWTTRGTTVGGVADTTNYATYIEAHGNTNGLCRWYTGATVVGNALFTGGAAMSTRAAGGTITLSTFDNDGVAWNPITGGTYTWVDGANTWEVTLTSEVTGVDLPAAADFANLGLTAWRATTILTGTGSESMLGTLWTLTETETIATAGQVFAQGAFTIDNQTTPASLYIKRSTGTVTTAADNASLPDINTTDFQVINLP